MIIAPVADLLDEAEIIIVPDRSFFKVPFAALEDESGNYLSETFRTMQAVLKSIGSVSLIHFAAHGDAERGEIVLAPPPLTNRISEEEDYLLTVADISEVRLRAKLVVLSCCHSASGHMRAEGVIGIARVFLGSGARSVLVALWAIQQSTFMRRVYEHLVRRECASESLHHTMKWIRSNGFSKVGQLAPFIYTLIGDDVTFDFRK